jgi:hypothetical protein
MTKIILAALCDDVRVEERNRHSLMGIFSQFNVNDFSSPLPPFCIYAIIGFDIAGSHSISILFRRVEGQPIFRAESNHDISVQDAATLQFHAMTNLRLNNLTLPGPGRYEFAFQCDGQYAGAIPLNVFQPPPRLIQ